MLFKIVLPLFLQALGIGVIIAEFFIPSGGFLSVLSFGLLGFSIYYAFVNISQAFGWSLVMADLIIVPVVVILGIKLILKSRAALKTELSSRDGVTSQSSDLGLFTGKNGTSITPLRPSGIALIEGKRIDVVTKGEFIQRNTPVTVVDVTANQVVVREAGL